MRIVTHQQIEGVEPGTTIDVDEERGAWLVGNGYASLAPEGVTPTGKEDEGVPRKSASKQEWVDYAVTEGAAEAEADGMTKAELIEAYG